MINFYLEIRSAGAFISQLSIIVWPYGNDFFTPPRYDAWITSPFNHRYYTHLFPEGFFQMDGIFLADGCYLFPHREREMKSDCNALYHLEGGNTPTIFLCTVQIILLYVRKKNPYEDF